MKVLNLDEYLDEYESKIYDFIRKNPGCNQSAIRNSKICSEMWAIKKVKSLLRKGYVEDRRIGKASHKYRVTNRKQYNLINKELDTIENEIMLDKAPLLEIAELQDKHGPLVVAAYMQKYVIPHRQSVFTRLFRLLKLSDIGIGKEDSLRLHTRIISLIANVTREPFFDENYKEILAANKNLLNILIRDLFKRGTLRTGLSVDSLRSIIKNIEKFEKQF